MVDEGKGLVSPTPSERSRFWPLTLATAIVFIGLVSLGVWQLQRLTWKENLIAQLEARQAGAPISLGRALELHRAGEDVRYLKVRCQGEFLHDQERYYYAPDVKLGPGYDVFTPLKLADKAGLIIANRGFVPEPLKAPPERSAGQVRGVQEVVGLIRLPGQKGYFTPENNTQTNLWFWRDFDAMAASLDEAETGPKLGLFIDVESAGHGGWPRGGTRKIELSNRHFGYAITWFGLAATLLGIYGTFMWGRSQN